MKKFVIGLIVGIVLCTPVAVKAWKIEPPYANKFLKIDDEQNSVSVFDDQDNKCYILYGDDNGSASVVQSVSISCVKR